MVRGGLYQSLGSRTVYVVVVPRGYEYVCTNEICNHHTAFRRDSRQPNLAPRDGLHTPSTPLFPVHDCDEDCYYEYVVLHSTCTGTEYGVQIWTRALADDKNSKGIDSPSLNISQESSSCSILHSTPCRYDGAELR
jgi:hypothetical protein